MTHPPAGARVAVPMDDGCYAIWEYANDYGRVQFVRYALTEAEAEACLFPAEPDRRLSTSTWVWDDADVIELVRVVRELLTPQDLAAEETLRDRLQEIVGRFEITE